MTALLLVALLLAGAWNPPVARATPAAAVQPGAVQGGSSVPGSVDPAGGGACPSVVVLAARGSEQNDDLIPTRYSAQAPWVSNGFEGPTLRNFLLFAEQRHRERTGDPLLADAAVLALDEHVYPAALPLPALAAAGEELGPRETLRRLGGVLSRAPAHRIIGHAGTEFAASVESAATGVRPMVTAFETASGCRPGYLLLGYSQGAIVLTLQESWLHEAGRMAGAVYLGNPLLAPGDPGTVLPAVRGGALRAVPAELRPGARTERRFNYCLPGDFACDIDAGAVTGAAAAHGGPHTAYFRTDANPGWDAAVADQFAAWVTGYTSHP